jgi:catechol 2,3-dioxygenase-like lactoylglutathione lyase family enzyme
LFENKGMPSGVPFCIPATPRAAAHPISMAPALSLSDLAPIAFVATRDAARAKAFYQGVLGLRLVSEELPFALVFDLDGVVLRVTIVKELTPAAYTILGWKTEDISATVRALQQSGVVFERYPGMAQDELGIWTAPGGAARVAWFKDLDGNTLSVSQH